MKRFQNIILTVLLAVFAFACKGGYIDEISKVEPGPDETAPIVTVKSPIDGYQIKIPGDSVASLTIDFEVTDDIELNTVTVKLDENEIQKYTDFKDYRRVKDVLVYGNVTDGAHVLEVIASDEEGKSTSVKVNFEKVPPYEPLFDGEIFYMPFDGDFMEMISLQKGTTIGSPQFVDEGYSQQAMAGTADSYLTFPTDGLLANEFSLTFWYKLNANPTRAGLISISPDGNDRSKGLRLFREGSATNQKLTLNFGDVSGEKWLTGTTLDPEVDEWVHIGVTISETTSTIYVNGEITATRESSFMDWTGCDGISIGSGAPNFNYWNHNSDQSLFDELRFFDKALTGSEVQLMIADTVWGQKYDAYQKKSFDDGDKTLPYRILYPEEFEEGKKYPLVLFLHGAGERGVDNEKQLNLGADLFIDDSRDAIVLFPQCPPEIMWTNREKEQNGEGEWEFRFPLGDAAPWPSQMVNQVVNQLVESGEVDENQMYVMGLSMGGIGALEFLARWPEKYASAVCIAGGHDPDLVSNYCNIPIWFFHGANDNVVPPIYSQRVYDELEQCSGGSTNSKYTLYPNGNHNSWDAAFNEPGLLDWLFSYQK